MLKQNKIIAMTKLAIYEKHKGGEASEASSYYREDYISNRILRGIIRFTAVYILLFFLYILMQGEELIFKMSFQFLVDLGRRTIVVYLIGLTVTVALFLFFSYFSYENAVEERDRYEQGLEEILSLSLGSGKERRKAREEGSEKILREQAVRKKAEDVILQMNKEGEKLEVTPLFSKTRSVEERKESLEKESFYPEEKNTVRKKSFTVTSEQSSEWLDEEDWLDE